MSVKTWNYKYEDNIVRRPNEEILPGVESPAIEAENRSLFDECPVQYDTTIPKCWIFSDTTISGLTLVGTNESVGSNVINTADVEAMPITP